MPTNTIFKTVYEQGAIAGYVLDPDTGLPAGGAGGPLRVQGEMTLDDGWTVDWFEDVTLNDSSKQWEVPTGRLWQILWLDVTLISSAGAGNRQLEVRVQRAGATKWTTMARAGIVQAASLTRYYHFAPGAPDLTAFRDTDWLATPLPVTTILRGGDTLQVWDKAAIAAAADELYAWLQYAWKEA